MPKAPSKNPKPSDTTVRMASDVYTMSRIVAAYRNMNVNEFLTETLRPLVTAMLAEEQAKWSLPGPESK